MGPSQPLAPTPELAIDFNVHFFSCIFKEDIMCSIRFLDDCELLCRTRLKSARIIIIVPLFGKEVVTAQRTLLYSRHLVILAFCVSLRLSEVLLSQFFMNFEP